MMETVAGTVLLFLLGLLGWALFSLLRFPAAPMIGALTVISALKILQFPVPAAPALLFPIIQILLGLFVGARVTRETIRELKDLFAPGAIIVAWALFMLFLLGSYLTCYAGLDIHTAILSSSIGGLPEMTVIALALNADAAVVIVMQTARMVITIAVFPVILKFWVGGRRAQRTAITRTNREVRDPVLPKPPAVWRRLRDSGLHLRARLLTACRPQRLICGARNIKQLLPSTGRVLLSLGVAAAGGWLLLRIGVPAGAMIGALFFTIAASLSGLKIKSPPRGYFGLIQVGVGIMVSNNISAQTIDTIVSGKLLSPIAISTLIILLSSLAVSLAIFKLTGWDFPACFLAAAPGGFTVMTTLAVKYGQDPFRVSMLHLCRLLAIKTVVPFVFMFYIK